MQLSLRLQAVADMVTPGNRTADVGCDHAYTSIYLVKNNLAPKAIAMDINKGPVERAKDNIEKYGLSDKIEVRRSDGLDQLKAGEADTILIAGMGGSLMVQILTGRMELVRDVKELVLQPQSEIHLVRQLLQDIGFLIVDENMVKDDGKYYVCMKAVPQHGVKSPEDYSLINDLQYYFGRLLLTMQHPVLKEYLERERCLCEEIYNELLLWPTEKSLERQKEILSMIGLIDRGLEYFHDKEIENEKC